jgi:hypothetical protein
VPFPAFFFIVSLKLEIETGCVGIDMGVHHTITFNLKT